MGKRTQSRTRTLIEGTLRCTRKGVCFVIPDAPAQRLKGDILVSEYNLGPALHGDKVAVYITGYNRGRPEGRVEKVIQHANPTVVGHFVKLRRDQHVVPIDEKFLYDIEIDADDTLGAEDGQIVNVEITRFPVAGRPPLGRVIEVLGYPDTPGIDIEIITRKHRLPHVFPAEVIEFAERLPEEIPPEEYARRLDLRGVPTVTIDGETARDFDDAISIEEQANGRFQLGVHIADVSYYVREGTVLDQEALRRGTSVYFPERAIPMLPERLSNGLCSLNPQVDRLAMSALMEVTEKGNVVDYRLVETVIRSDERMTYTNVNKIVTDRDPAALDRYANLVEMFDTMRKLAGLMIAKRQTRGAIDFDLPEPVVLFNDEGQICGIVRSERNIAHRIIEEFMLLANEVVATHLHELGVPSLYRIHDEPDPKKVAEFAELASSFGHRLKFRSGRLASKDFQRFTEQIRGTPEERFLSYLMLRSLPQARYSSEATGHFGLAAKLYTHFTSPIRRYPDLIVHRILREILQSGEAAPASRPAAERPAASARKRRASAAPSGAEPVSELTGLLSAADASKVEVGRREALYHLTSAPLPAERLDQWLEKLEPIALQSSERERAAVSAERELLDWKKAEFMAQHVGAEFDGIITGVKDYGLYVELNDLFIEGLVHISTLIDDYYVFKEKTHSLVGERGRAFRLGDEVRVLVDRVDHDRHLIDFSVVDLRPVRRVGGRRRSRR